MTRNHGGGSIGRAIIEKNSVRRNRGGGIMEEQSLSKKHGEDIWGASGSSLGSIWDGLGSHLGVIWEPFGSHLGVIWEPFGSHLGDTWEDGG